MHPTMKVPSRWCERGLEAARLKRRSLSRWWERPEELVVPEGHRWKARSALRAVGRM